MPLTPTQSTFLKEKLNVEPKKKRFFGIFGEGDDATQANTAFKIYLEQEAAVISKLDELGGYSGTADQVAEFEKLVKNQQDFAREAKDSAEFKEKFPEASAKLALIEKSVKNLIKANIAYQTYLEKERPVHTKIVDLKVYSGTAGQVVNFKKEMDALRMRAQNAKNSADFKKEFPQATADLTTIGTEVDKTIREAKAAESARKKHLDREETVSKKLNELGRYVETIQKIRDFDATLDKLHGEVVGAKGIFAGQEITDAYQRLKQLEKDVDAAISEAKIADPACNAREAYDQALRRARDLIALLSVIPKANAESMRQNAKAAEELAEVAWQSDQINRPSTKEPWEAAKAALGDFEKDFKTQKAFAERMKKLELDQWAKKPDVQLQLANSKDLLEKLRTLPGVSDVITQYEAIIQAAEKKANDNDWMGAVAKLDELKNLPNEKACIQTSQNALTALDDNADYRDGKSYISQLHELSDKSSFVKLETEFQAVVNSILVPDTAEKSKAIETLATTVGSLKSELEKCDSLSAELSKMIKPKIDSEFLQLQAVAPPMEIGPIALQIESFDTLLTAKKLGLAKEQGDRLIVRINLLLLDRQKAFEDWQKVQTNANEVYSQLDKLFGETLCKSVKDDAFMARGLVSPDKIRVLSDEKNWMKLVDNLKRGIAEAARLVELNNQYVGFTDDRNKADIKVQAEIISTKEAIEKLKTAVEIAGKDLPKPSLIHESDLASIEESWKVTLTKATNTVELDLAATLSRLEQIKSTAENQSSQGGIQAQLDDYEKEQARIDFQKSWSSLEQTIDELQKYDYKAATQFRKEAMSIRNSATLNWNKGYNDLEELKKRVEDVQLDVQKNQLIFQEQVEILAGLVKQNIEDVENGVQNKEKFAPLFDALKAELEDIQALASSTNVGALEGAMSELKLLLLRVKNLEPEAVTDDRPSLDAVFNFFEAEEKALGEMKSTLKTNNPSGLESLSKQLEELRTEVLAQDPEISIKQLKKFGVSRAGAAVNAQIVNEIRGEFVTRLESVNKSLKIFTDRKEAPEYAKSLVARIAEAEKIAVKPDDLYYANVKLKVIEDELNSAILDSKVGVQKEGELLQKKKNDDAAKKEWEKSLELFKSKRIVQAVTAVKENKGDESLIKEILRMQEVAEETAKSGDHVKALNQLQVAGMRVDEIVKDPYGPAIGSRNNLPKDEQVYQKAIDAFHQAIEALPSELISKVEGSLDEKVRNKLDALLLNATSKFDKNAFSSILIQLGNDKSDANQRRAFREQALMKVRSVQSVLSNDPILIGLQENPISKAIAKTGRQLGSSLTRLEANISRCCK